MHKRMVEGDGRLGRDEAGVLDNAIAAVLLGRSGWGRAKEKAVLVERTVLLRFVWEKPPADEAKRLKVGQGGGG